MANKFWWNDPITHFLQGEGINWISTTQKKKKIPLIQNKEDTHGVSRRVWHRHELEVSVVVSTLYSLITNLVNGGFARDINGDAILMMFVRVGQVFPFWRRRRECRLQPQHQRVFDGACVIWWAHHHHQRWNLISISIP